MKFAVIKNNNDRLRDQAAEELVERCLSHGHILSDNLYDVNFILNLTSISDPQVFKRRSKCVFLITMVSGEGLNGNIQSVCYTTLIKTFANLLICVKPTDQAEESRTFFTTPEAGFYNISYDPEKIYQLMMPVAGAHFATDNTFTADLPERYYSPSPVVKEIAKFGREMNKLGVLPAPFPLTELLSRDDMLHLYRVFGITGASYGNLSAKEDIPEFKPPVFWMSGRGINKSEISKVGRDVLLVKDFDYNTGTAEISQPAGYDKKARVSVDAVEHAMIYRNFPGTGAIIHLHAWMDDVLCTHQNHPCGTIELAEEVVELLKKTENPACSVVGLKNHGLTITGSSLDEIFSRISGKLKTEVPMFA
jgi:ribulose-5-phosphate 4-epimerase/fuculose-1-phosphate aldolase